MVIDLEQIAIRVGVDPSIFKPEDTNFATSIFWDVYVYLQNNILSIFSEAFDVVFELLGSFTDVKSYFSQADYLLNCMADVATLILTIIFLKHIFTNYILNLDGESDSDPIQMLVKLATALAVINCGGEIHEILMTICRYFEEYLLLIAFETSTQISIGKEFILNFFEQVLGHFLTLGFASINIIVVSIWIIVVLILLIVLICKICIRGAELFIFQCLFPFFACDLITKEKALWRPFFKAYLITIFGFLVQYVCLWLSIEIISSEITFEAGIAGFAAPLIGTAMLFLACKAPKWLQEFTYQTGTGQTVSGAARGAMGGATQIVSIVKAFK